MNSSASRIKIVHQQVEKLIEEIALLKNDKNEMINTNLALVKEIDVQKRELEDLNQKMQTLKLAKSIRGDDKPQETKELKRKINEYIKEIDRCIALLNH
jgi:acetolactate synthase small subunit|tara:strand:+ start:685 stop:981 length:297 start_codon:yes stop_codon:yes gene_type:complete